MRWEYHHFTNEGTEAQGLQNLPRAGQLVSSTAGLDTRQCGSRVYDPLDLVHKGLFASTLPWCPQSPPFLAPMEPLSRLIYLKKNKKAAQRQSLRDCVILGDDGADRLGGGCADPTSPRQHPCSHGVIATPPRGLTVPV